MQEGARILRYLHAMPQGGGFEDAEMSWAHGPGTGRVVGARPSVFMIPGIAKEIEGQWGQRLAISGPPGRWGRVVAFAGPQFHAWNHEVQFHAPLVFVANPKGVIAVGLKSGKRRALELVHELLLLRWSGRVGRGKADDP